MLTKNNELNGAWEEPGVIGTRIEISGSRLTVLWRNSPVLETKFSTKKQAGRTDLLPKSRGFRYKSAISDYAELKELYFEDGKLVLIEHFPITGDSETKLEKTDRSRYGDYTIADEALNELKGTWIDDHGFLPLVFEGNTLLMGEKKHKIHLLRSNGKYAHHGQLKIVDIDPSVYGWDGLCDFVYDGGIITARMDVCDAQAILFEYHRKPE